MFSFSCCTTELHNTCLLATLFISSNSSKLYVSSKLYKQLCIFVHLLYDHFAQSAPAAPPPLPPLPPPIPIPILAEVCARRRLDENHVALLRLLVAFVKGLDEEDDPAALR